MQVRRSIAITFVASNLNMVIMFVVSIVAARFLTPTDIGVFSIAAVCIALFGVVRDLGTNAYLMQVRSLDRQRVGAVLGLTLGSSWVLAICLLAARQPLADWFSAPALPEVLLILIGSFLLVPYAAVLVSLLQRDLMARELALIGLGGTLAYSVTCLSLAAWGMGAASLAWANFANLVVSLLLYWFYRPPLMTWRPRFRDWREPLSTGGGAMLGQLAHVAHTSVPDLALGRLQGPYDVGLFSRANGLVGLFQQVMGPTVNAIALPVMARQHHQDMAVAAPLARGCAYMTVVAWPAFIWVALFSSDIIGLLYGPAWLSAAPLVPALCLAAAAKVAYQLTQPALVAVGRPYAGAMVLIVGLLLRAGSVWCWGTQDLTAFLWALVLADLLTVPVQAAMASRWLGLSVRLIVQAFRGSLLVAAAVALAAAGARWLLSDATNAAAVAGSAAMVCVAWLLSVLALKHPISLELNTLWMNRPWSRQRT